MEKLVAPPAIAARRRLRRFHQQKTKQAVALFTDMAQPSSFSAGIFFWNQTQIGRDLLAAVEPLGFTDDQHKGYCSQSSYTWVRHPTLRLWTFLRLRLDRLRQTGNGRVDAVQHLQQVFPPATGPGSQR